MSAPPTADGGGDPLVSVVVVNYNGADALPACLDALIAGSGDVCAEILVVDNASADGSAEIADAIAEANDSVRVLRSPTNRGYAGAVNFALEEARGPYVAVLNMDVIVSPGWLRPLADLLDSNPDAGVACPLMVLESDPDRINAAGQDLHVTGLGWNRWLDKPRETAGTDPFQVDGLHGAAFLIRGDLLRELGGWDEDGFLYFEDVELSWLLRIAGMEVHCVPASTVVHDYHLSMFPEKLFLLERNRGAMLAADLHLGAKLVLGPVRALTELLMWGYCVLRGPGFMRAKWRAYCWVAKHRERTRERRRQVDSVRRRSDWAVLRGLRWGYPLGQFLTLGRERGESERNRLG